MAGCPTPEQWFSMLRGHQGSDAIQAWAAHLDACEECWSLVVDPDFLAEQTKPTSSPGTSSSTPLCPGFADLPADVTSISDAQHFPPGRRLGPFRIISLLGHGGLARVYLAIDERCGRRVAVKCPNPKGTPAAQYYPAAHEARMHSRLQHPNIIQLLEFNLDHSPPFLVLEFATRGSLRKLLGTQQLTQQMSQQLITILARAVHAAHACGVLHLDLKPDNILLTENPTAAKFHHADSNSPDNALPWTPKLADFGMSCILLEKDPAAGVPLKLQGTLKWMAPEQFSGDPSQLGPATDVHALGAILYELLTGLCPFRSTHDLELCGQICLRTPLPPKKLNPHISEELNQICVRCLKKAPADRFQSAAELADALDSITTVTPPRRWHKLPGKLNLQPSLRTIFGCSLLLLTVGLLLGASFCLRNSLLNTNIPTASSANTASNRVVVWSPPSKPPRTTQPPPPGFTTKSQLARTQAPTPLAPTEPTFLSTILPAAMEFSEPLKRP